MYAWGRSHSFPCSDLTVHRQTPRDSQGISFPAAGLSWRRASGRFAAFSLGRPPPPRDLGPPGGAHPAGGQHHGGHVLRRGLAPQLGAGWSRDRATWSGADKGPLGSRTRNPRELVPSWDSWEPGSNLHGQPVTGSLSRSDAASLPNELHQVGSLQTCAPEPRGAGGWVRGGWGCASLLSTLPMQTPRVGTLNHC